MEVLTIILLFACNSKGSVVETLTNLCTKYTSGGDVVEILTAILSLYALLAPLECSVVETLTIILLCACNSKGSVLEVH